MQPNLTSHFAFDEQVHKGSILWQQEHLEANKKPLDCKLESKGSALYNNLLAKNDNLRDNTGFQTILKIIEEFLLCQIFSKAEETENKPDVKGAQIISSSK